MSTLIDSNENEIELIHSSNETKDETELKDCMLSTVDNPYSPFSQWQEWYKYDVEKGHESCAYLARIAKTSDELSDEENILEKERAIDQIVKYDPFGLYIKVVER